MGFEERLTALENRAYATERALLIVSKAIADTLPAFVVHDRLKELAAFIPDAEHDADQARVDMVRELLLTIIVGSGPAKGV